MALYRCHPDLGSRAGTAFTLTALLCAVWSETSPGLVDAASAGHKFPKLLLISLDGFGWHFLGKLPKSRTPNFHAVMERGVHVRWMENVFPSKTLPNHMTLVSGLYPESHGIVNNKFFDPVLKAALPGATDPRFDSAWTDVGAEPIWVTNSKAGQGRRSGSVYWPCSQVKIKGWIPEELKKEEPGVSSEDVSYNQRIDMALDWLTSESSAQVNFAAVYTHGVDEVSHKFGPDSQQMLDQIVSCDDTIGHLLSRMKEKKLDEELNVIITADHGHSPIYPQQMVNIDQLLDPSWYTTYPDLSKRFRLMVNLWPKEGFHDKVVEALKGDHRNLHVAVKGKSEDLVLMHYSENRRIAPVVLYAEPGWVIGRTNATFKSGKGEHGWDPRYDPFMYPIFMAMGPAFRRGLHHAQPFHMVNVYPLMCHILGLQPAPNNGSLSHTAHLLAPPRASFAAYVWGKQKLKSEKVINPTLYTSDDFVKTSAEEVPGKGAGVGIAVVVLSLAVIVFVVRRARKSTDVPVWYKRTFTTEGSAQDLLEDGKVVLSDEEI